MGAALFGASPERTCPSPQFPGAVHSEAYVVGHGTQGRLFTQQWVPEAGPPKALIMLCHGYIDHSSWLVADIQARLYLSMGYAVFAMDYIGHGKSSGLLAYVESWDALCDDVLHHYLQVRAQFPGFKAFLVGESMGGAVALAIAHRDPKVADGVILVAPMCKIADDMLPSPLVISVLRCVAYVGPTWPLVPQDTDILLKCMKDPEMLQRAQANPIRYLSRPRLATALQLLHATQGVEALAPQFTFPMLILHGAADHVTTPEASQALYERSGAKDKELKVYPGAWHALFAEPEPTYSKLRQDVKEWLEART